MQLEHERNLNISPMQQQGKQYHIICKRRTGLKTDKYEDPEEVLQCFLKNTMNTKNDIKLHKVHRLGRRRRAKLKPRPIIAKIADPEEKNKVKLSAGNKRT